jgi:hypothetical protein
LNDKSVGYQDVTKRSKIPKSALLAGAAIGLPLAANADIVYTPLNVTVSSDTSTDATYQFQGPDGVNDFLFTASFQNWTDSVTPENSSGYVGTDTNNPTPVPGGTQIGPSSGPFQLGTGTLTYGVVYEKGPWSNNAFQLLGVEFYIGAVNPSDLHYGWISLSACTPAYKGSPCSDPSVIQINGFAYNTVANAPINAPASTPEPSALPMLALGAAGLAAFRARRKKAA